MGFGFDEVTTVKSIEDRQEFYIVEVELYEGAMLSRDIMVIRARSRALISTGIVENVGNKTREVLKAIREMDFGKIDRFTEVEDGEFEGNVVTVKVHKK